jgi:predicted small lipoprotein YifL
MPHAPGYAERAMRLLLAIAVVLSGCSGKGPDELPDPDVKGAAAAPDGTPYPTANIGSNPGQVAPNLAFEGYPSSNKSAGLKVYSFADLFDPAAKDHKLLYLSLAATWCSSCVAEAAEIARILPRYAPQGVIVVEVLVAGASSGFGPSQAELDGWVDANHTSWTVLADVRGRRTGPGLGLTAVPASMLVDTRTMEIIHASLGAPDDLGAYFQIGLNWIAQHPR